MNTVHIVGMGTGPGDLGERHRGIIACADVLVGARRHLEVFREHPARKKEIASPLSEVIAYIQEAGAGMRVVVLASGDPLFYGIGQTLARELGEENVAIVPNVSVMAEAFGRIRKPWNDAVCVSLHGRNACALMIHLLAGRRPVFLYTDSIRSPAWVARIIAERAPGRWRLCVLERLGEPGEKISWLAAEEAAARCFQQPNAVLLWPDDEAGEAVYPVLGGPEELYRHERGMITKPEVRAVTLSKLRLEPDHVLWDLGAGSGSVSIEAALLVTRGRIVAVEQKDDRVEHIRENLRRFAAPQVELRQLDLPEGMAALPDPDRVFVGGGGGGLEAVLRPAAERLPAGGRIVVNAVVMETVATGLAVLRELGFVVETVQLQVNRGAEMPAGTRIAAANPVFVIAGQKP